MFKIDGPFMSFLSKVSDLLIINVLVILFSIPVVTIGASVTAGYYVLYKHIKDEDGYLFKTFVKAFKQNFKQSSIMWIVMLVVFAIFFVDYKILFPTGLEFTSLKAVKLVIIAATVVVSMGLAYVFPLQARFSNTIKNTFKNAFLMALAHFPISIIVVAVIPLPIIIATFVAEVIPLVVLFGVSLVMYTQAYFLLKVFKKYEIHTEDDTVQKNEDSGIFAGSDSMEL